MTGEEWALAASSFFSGLAAGFLGGLCTILRPMQAAMTGPDFRTFMERFLRYADNGLGKVFNYAWSGGTTIASIVALVLLWDDPGSTSFVLTAIGLGVWVVGILIVSNVWKTPTYKMILAGDPRRAGGLGGDTTALLHDQLAPTRDHLGGVRPLSRCPRGAVADPLVCCRGWGLDELATTGRKHIEERGRQVDGLEVEDPPPKR
jgi:hypothetical protein